MNAKTGSSDVLGQFWEDQRDQRPERQEMNEAGERAVVATSDGRVPYFIRPEIKDFCFSFF